MITSFMSLREWLNESVDEPTFNEIFRVKNKWVPITQEQKEALADNFFRLIDLSYRPLDGHLKVKSPEDLKRLDWDVFFANDIDDDPHADVVLFGKRTPYGVKLIGGGSDGSLEGKKHLIYQKGYTLEKDGAYAEASGKAYMINKNKFNVPIIKDPDVVRHVLNKPIEWLGPHPDGKDGDPYNNPYWYKRKIGDKIVTKILMGRPILT